MQTSSSTAPPRGDGTVVTDTTSATFSMVPGEMGAFGFTEKTM